MNFFRTNTNASSATIPSSASAARDLDMRSIYMNPEFYSASLVKGNFRQIVTLPKHMDLNEWVDYTWTDSRGRTVKLPAPQYVDYFMTWTQNILNDQSVFPTKSGTEFPPTFVTTIRQIHKQLVRVFVHMYSTHATRIEELSLQAHLNTLFAHVLCFGKEFDLIERKDLTALADFVALLDSVHSLGLVL
ncbi:Maintenance of ploidy protein mob2 [Entophlyctis luteolus]|nr:Maintenance of ploidy protein mob2 [Entophlyctis luteolus]